MDVFTRVVADYARHGRAPSFDDVARLNLSANAALALNIIASIEIGRREMLAEDSFVSDGAGI